MERRRRTDHLPLSEVLSGEPQTRSHLACELLTAVGFAAATVIQVPHGGGAGMRVCATGRAEHLVDIAAGIARQAVATGRALTMTDTRDRIGIRKWRHAAVPLGAVKEGTLVLVVSDQKLSQRDGQAIAAWCAPEHVGSMYVDGGACRDLVRALAAEFGADVIVLSLFAHVGMHQRLFVRSGGLLHGWRAPADTVWSEVARHGAAFTLGELHLHPGAELLASIGMSSAGLVGLENGAGLPIGALGVASTSDLSVDVAHHLLERAPKLGPQIMRELSSTKVPSMDKNGAIDLQVLAARVGCRRFSVYSRIDGALKLANAFANDGSKLVSPPDLEEFQIVEWASSQGMGVAVANAAAIPLGEHTVLYAADPLRKPLDSLRLALQDVYLDPFGGAEAA